MDIDFLCVCVCVRVCVCTVLLNVIYYYESDGMVVAVICVAWDLILHTLICITLMNMREGRGQERVEVDSS